MRISLAVLFALLVPAFAFAQLPPKEGDIWVMAGDSITAQKQHSNYFEAFCYARYPKVKFAFRNSGVGGHTIPTTLARFDYDIAAWKPTVVSVELGMNDKGGTETPKFIANMGTMVGRIRAIKAQPVIFSASPVNNGETMMTLGGNKRLDEYAVALKDFCAKEQIPYADQFHRLVDIWGHNKPNEILFNSLPIMKSIAQRKDINGVEHLKAFVEVQEKSPVKLVSLQGDAVHPGPPGQLMMAAALLKELGASGFVSSAVIRADKVTSKGCTITNLVLTDNGLAFDRLDEASPFPIPEEARGAIGIYPMILDLSEYTLSVGALKGDKFVLKIDGAELATLSAIELEKGINLTSFPLATPGKAINPIALQGKQILEAVSAGQSKVGQWRDLSKAAHAKDAKPELMTQLAAMAKSVEASDAAIRAVAAPKTRRFEIVPVK